MTRRSYVGRNKDLNDVIFSTIDSEEKAYVLGLIASDVNITRGTITIALHQKDSHVLERVAKLFSEDIRVKRKLLTSLSYFSINSQTIVRDVCDALKIEPEKKSYDVGFPDLESDFLTCAFIRGFFDGGGTIRDTDCQNLDCKITTNSTPFKKGLTAFLNKEIDITKEDIWWYGNDALDFLGKLYDSASIYLPRKRDLYLDWCMFIPSLAGRGLRGREFLFKWNKTRKDAVAPKKENVTDSGFDLVILEKVRQLGEVGLYDTGIKIQPAYGWYFDLVPRSSIIKTGYALANSVGIIDRTYKGTILVPLIKVDPTVGDLDLPSRLVQIIPRPIVHANFIEVCELDDTNRGDGGFGSTGRN